MLYKMKMFMAKIFSTNKKIKRAVLTQRLHGSIKYFAYAQCYAYISIPLSF